MVVVMERSVFDYMAKSLDLDLHSKNICYKVEVVECEREIKRNPLIIKFSLFSICELKLANYCYVQ